MKANHNLLTCLIPTQIVVVNISSSKNRVYELMNTNKNRNNQWIMKANHNNCAVSKLFDGVVVNISSSKNRVYELMNTNKNRNNQWIMKANHNFVGDLLSFLFSSRKLATTDWIPVHPIYSSSSPTYSPPHQYNHSWNSYKYLLRDR